MAPHLGVAGYASAADPTGILPGAPFEGGMPGDRVPVQLGMGPGAAFGATRSEPADGWRRGLVTAIRVLWLVALAGYLGLVDDGIAPFTAGGLTGVAVLLGGYARIRWTGARPPAPDRPATVAAVAGVALLLLAVPATMLGALTIARTAAVAAVTAATLAALLVRRPPRRPPESHPG